MPNLSTPCRSCGGVVCVIHPQGGIRSYECFNTQKKVCRICFRHLAVYEGSACDRCEDEGGMMMVGNA